MRSVLTKKLLIIVYSTTKTIKTLLLNMPGDNCFMFGSVTCRRTKGIGIWKLPAAQNEAYRK